MSNTENATPGPWEWGGLVPANGTGKQYMNIRGDNGEWVAQLQTENAEVNARLIVNAVNHHDELVAALKRAWHDIEHGTDDAGDTQRAIEQALTAAGEEI